MPKVKRHTKASQANSTPVTDGTRVVALFGSIGMLAAWDMNGKPLWKTDVGVLDSGWFFDPTYQWGHSSSPIIYKGTVIVQADVHKELVHRRLRPEDRQADCGAPTVTRSPSWGTPTVFDGEQIVTNGPKVRGYDPATGKLLWTLGPNSEVTVGTPVVGEGLVYVTGGYPPVRPIYAVKPTAAGDISLPKDTTSSDAIAWSNTSGTYIPTPIYYDGILYTCSNDGVLTAYDAKTGERVYRARVGGGGSFSASPIAADGQLYFANEDGDVIVVARRPQVRGAREEPDEGSDHEHAGHLGRAHRRPHAGTCLRCGGDEALVQAFGYHRVAAPARRRLSHSDARATSFGEASPKRAGILGARRRVFPTRRARGARSLWERNDWVGVRISTESLFCEQPRTNKNTECRCPRRERTRAPASCRRRPALRGQTRSRRQAAIETGLLVSSVSSDHARARAARVRAGG